jgi:hypothetical protein
MEILRPYIGQNLRDVDRKIIYEVCKPRFLSNPHCEDCNYKCEDCIWNKFYNKKYNKPCDWQVLEDDSCSNLNNGYNLGDRTPSFVTDFFGVGKSLGGLNDVYSNFGGFSFEWNVTYGKLKDHEIYEQGFNRSYNMLVNLKEWTELKCWGRDIKVSSKKLLDK